MLAAAVAKLLLVELEWVDFREHEPGGNTFVQDVPSAPDECLSLFGSGGDPQPTLDPSDAPVLQVRSRGAERDPVTPYERLRAISAVLACMDLVWLDEGGAHEVFVVSCTPLQSDPVPMGMDGSQRHEWSLNFAFDTHAPTAHRPA